MNKIFHLLRLTLLGCVMVGAVTANAGKIDTEKNFVVATVDKYPITHYDVKKNLNKFRQLMAINSSIDLVEKELYQQTLDFLILERVQLNIAKLNGIVIDEAMIDSGIVNFAQQSGQTMTQLAQGLTAEGIGLAEFREDIRDQMIIMRLREVGLFQGGKISKYEIRNYLKLQEKGNDIENFDLNLGQILISIPEGADPQQIEQLEQRAQQALAQTQQQQNFQQVAQQYSDADNSIETGLRAANSFPSLFLQQVRDLPRYGVTPVFRSSAGFHILKVLDKARQGSPAALITKPHVRHIILMPNEKADAEQVVAALQELRQNIQAGKISFSIAAKTYSQDGSAAYGGDLGWVVPGSMVPEFEEAVAALPVGVLSQPIETRFGYHLIEVIEVRQEQLAGAERDELVRKQLAQEKQQQAFEDWLRELRSNAVVEYKVAVN